MFRCGALALVLIAATGLAEPPQFSTGAFRLTLQYGPGIWALDKAKLASQLPPANPNGDLAQIFVSEVQNTHTVTMGLAYDILGHASLGVDLTATGWNLPEVTRGGAGFLVGKVAWHPLELVWIKKTKRPVPLDISGFFGAGYGIVGQRTGIDGLVFETGFTADYFFTRFFGLGFFARFVFLNGSAFYLDYNNRSLPGNTVALPQGSGGLFTTLGFSLHFRAGD